MQSKDKILNQIRTSVLEILPGSEIILFGSRARNDAIDTRPLATAGVPEQREYKGRGVIKDEEIGEFSNIVTVTFGG